MTSGEASQDPTIETPDIPPEIAASLVHGFLDRQYRKTLDEPVPMLDGLSPRLPSMAGKKSPTGSNIWKPIGQFRRSGRSDGNLRLRMDLAGTRHRKPSTLRATVYLCPNALEPPRVAEHSFYVIRSRPCRGIHFKVILEPVTGSLPADASLFIPPNGAASEDIRQVLIPTMPYPKASATRQTRFRLEA